MAETASKVVVGGATAQALAKAGDEKGLGFEECTASKEIVQAWAAAKHLVSIGQHDARFRAITGKGDTYWRLGCGEALHLTVDEPKIQLGFV